MTAASILVVGAGLTGSTIARCLAEADDGKTIRVVDRKPHVAGNCYDPVDNLTGIRYHLHGPHAFHTNSEKVWRYLSRFTRWTPYEHRVMAEISGIGLVPVPCNYTTLTSILGARRGGEVVQTLARVFDADAAVPVMALLNHSDPVAKLAGEVAYEEIFLGYTIKQWGLEPEDVGPSVMGRVPVRMGWDDRYFRDEYQALPADGYEAMVTRMLDHPSIEVSLATEADRSTFATFQYVVYTGAIDELLAYGLGPLPYRSLSFEFEALDIFSLQPVTQVNYPGEVPWTRITEFKHFGQQPSAKTLIAREIPGTHEPGKNDPYYPLASDAARSLHKEYVRLASKLHPNIVPAGRLADYRYYNMDQAVARGLQVAHELNCNVGHEKAPTHGS